MGIYTSEEWKNSRSRWIAWGGNKSAIIHFCQRSHPLTTASFTLGELVIPNSSHYVYLGIPGVQVFSLSQYSKHPLAAAPGDMCWMPTSYRHKWPCTVAFWKHLTQIILITTEFTRIKVYIECKRLAEEQNQDNRASQVKQTLAGCGLQS